MHVILPGFSCIVFTDEQKAQAVTEGYCEIYIVTALGMLKRMSMTHGRSITMPVTEIPGAKLCTDTMDVDSFFPRDEAGKPLKMPIKLLHEIVAFFREVMAANAGQNLEAQAHIVWNPVLGYHVRVPVQTVSAARVSYSWEGYLAADDVIVLDIHSHNNMGAFFSGTDDADDKGTGCYSAVIGKISSKPEFVCRFNVPGGKSKIKDVDLFSLFAEERIDVEVPKAWLENVKKEVPAVYGSNFRGGRAGNSYDRFDDFGDYGVGGNVRGNYRNQAGLGSVHGGKTQGSYPGSRQHAQAQNNAGAHSRGGQTSLLNTQSMEMGDLLESLGYPFVPDLALEGDQGFQKPSRGRGKNKRVSNTTPRKAPK